MRVVCRGYLHGNLNGRGYLYGNLFPTDYGHARLTVASCK